MKDNLEKKNISSWLLGILIAFIFLVLILHFLEPMGRSLVIALAFFYIIVLPGFSLSCVFFTLKALDPLEHIVVGSALSMFIIPLLVYFSNIYIHIRVTQQFLIFLATLIIGISVIICVLRQQNNSVHDKS